MVDRVLDEGPQSRGMGVFPIDRRWALEWELIDEMQETAEVSSLTQPWLFEPHQAILNRQ